MFCWKDYSTKQLYISDTLCVQPNDCITWDTRKNYVQIIDIFGNEKEPVGFEYESYQDGKWSGRKFIHLNNIHLDTIIKDEAPVHPTMPGDVTLTSPLTILEVRHQIIQMCWDNNLDGKYDYCTYYCSKDDNKFKLCISRLGSGHRIDIYYVFGDINTIKKYIHLLPFYIKN